MENKEQELQVRIINLAEAEKPEFNEVRGQDWVTAGEDNKLFDNLIEYSNYSSTHKSILTTKIDAVSGDEIIFEEGNFVNPGDSLDELSDKIAADLEIVGAYAIEVIYSLAGTPAELNHIPIQRLRYQKEDESGKIKGLYYSKHWEDTRKYKPVFIPFYNPINSKREKRQVLLVKKYWPGSPYEIVPSYYASLNYIKVDYEISLFHLNNIQTGFNPGLILSFNDRELYSNPDLIRKMSDKFEKKYKGSKGSKLLMLFNKSAESKTEITQLEGSDHDKMFETLVESVSQQILTSHQLTNPQLAGIKTPGELGGGGNQLLQSYELFQNNVIRPDQRLVENGFNKILSQLNAKIKIKNSTSMKFGFSENMLMSILTLEELRSIVGYEMLEANQIPLIVK